MVASPTPEPVPLAADPDAGHAAAWPVDGIGPASPASGFRRATSLLEVGLCCGLPTQTLVFLLLWLLGQTPANPTELTLRFVVLHSALDTVLVVCLILLFLRRSGESPAAVFVGRRRGVREAALGLLLLPAVFLLVAAAGVTIQRWAPWMQPPDNPFAALLDTRTGLIAFAAVGVVAGGVREELQRAFILHRSEQHLGGAAVGLLVFSVLFGLGHYVQGPAAVVMTGLLGLFWGLLYLARRSVIAPVVSHSAFNLVEVVGFGLLR
jgi:membrane protease YdiL (CAAX protease family)